MSKLMIEQPDGTLCPCTSANAPSAARSITLDDRTRAALESGVMDGLFSAFDTQDPLSGFTQVASAGNVMSDGEGENGGFVQSRPPSALEPGEEATFLGLRVSSQIPTSRSDITQSWPTAEEAVEAAATEIRTLAKNYYHDYEEMRLGNYMLPEAGVRIIELSSKRFTYTDIIVGTATGGYDVTKGTDDSGKVDFKEVESNIGGLAARLHFHWVDLTPSQRDSRFAENTAHERVKLGKKTYEAWVASYDSKSRYFLLDQREV